MGNWFGWPKKDAAYKGEHLGGFEVVYGRFPSTIFVRSCKFTPVSRGPLSTVSGMRKIHESLL
jgi:hypothetical protein